MKSIGGSAVRKAASFGDLLSIYHIPLDVSWYLYVLWWIFIFMGFISIWIKDTNKLLILTIILFVFSIVNPQKIYIIQKLMLWLLFFVLGYWLRKTNITELLERKWKNVSLICIVMITIFMIIWQLGNPTFYASYHVPGLKGLIFPVSVILAFAIYPIISKIELFGNYFKTYGKDSIIIYLLHGSIVSVTRIVLLKVGIDNVFLHIIIGLLTGWFGSIIAIHITKKIKYLDFVFYPMKYIKK